MARLTFGTTPWSRKIFSNNEGSLNHYFNETTYGNYQFSPATESGGWFKNRYKSVGELKGINMRIYGLGCKVMEKFGIAIIEAQGQKFNPELHEAVSTQEAGEYKPGEVVAVMQKGYTLNGRLIRPAMVVVAK